MSARRAPRWYQLSLRTLLLLVAVASVPLGGHVAYKSYLVRKRLAEIEGSFRWLESLGKSYLTIERDDLRTTARQALDHASSKNPDPLHNFGRVLSERGELFVLSWASARNGYGDLAIKLYEAAEACPNWNDNRESPTSFLDRLAADFAYMETWQATLACETKVPRAELLQNFRWLQQHFPNSKYGADVAEKIAILEVMVAEDEQHARERDAGLPFEQLSKEEQIAELIFQLREQNGHQFSQPGSCDVFMTEDGEWFGTKGSSSGHRLLAFGYDAIPQLAAALSDRRLTRSVGYHRDFYFSHTVLTVGDAAEQILERIASRSFDPSERYEDKTARIAEVQRNALAWHAELMAKGERRCLIEAVQKGDRTSLSLSYLLMEKYPDDGCSAILRAIPNAEDDYPRESFVGLLGQVHSDEPVPFLLGELQHEKPRARLTAAKALTAVGRSDGLEAIIREWQRSGRVTELEYYGPFLAGCGRGDTVLAVAMRFSEQAIDQRVETMQEVMRYSPEVFAAQPELREAVIELLLIALGDTDVRSGMSIGFGDKSISDPRVCDLAGHYLNDLDPGTYRFDLNASMRQREAARRAILQSRASQ